MALDDYLNSPAVQAHFAEHYRKRDAADIEIRQLGLLHWEWRFYFGRYITGRYLVRWTEYEQGTAWTERSARRAAAKQLRSLHKSDPAWSR